MRVSCNGCRVLRKGCGEDCSIRSCLDWIESPESQANATVFLAKFYGRTGLVNLINASPLHLRPAIFRSLLHEACGRIANPIYGSMGLLWSGSWQLCQAAVDAVLKGEPITPITTDTAAPPVKVYDIRHFSTEKNSAANGSTRRAILGSMEPKGKSNADAGHEFDVESDGKEELGTEPAVLARGNYIVVPLKKRKMGVFRTCQVDEDTCKKD